MSVRPARQDLAAMGRPSTYDPATRTKLCPSCGKRKGLRCFNRRSSTGSGVGRRSYCRVCERDKAQARRRRAPDADAARRSAYYRNRPEKRLEYHLRSRYGLELADYYRMAAEQDHRCAICRRPESEDHGRLSVDHDADTGKVRGLLCAPCNRGIGSLRHDTTSLRAAADYLERTS